MVRFFDNGKESRESHDDFENIIETFDRRDEFADKFILYQVSYKKQYWKGL